MAEEKQASDSRDPNPEARIEPDSPSVSDGEGTDSERAVCSCGAGPHATDPNRCAKGHPIAGNQLARKNPVNEARREHYLRKLVVDYEPQTTLLCATCEHLAATFERLETTRRGSTEWQRLINVAQTLGAALEASRTAREERDATIPETNEVRRVIVEPEANLTLEQLEARLDRTKKRIAALRGKPSDPDGASEAVGAPEPEFSDPALVPSLLRSGSLETPPNASRAEPKEKPAESRCSYCHHPIARCRELRDRQLDNWRALHWNDPEEIKRRDELATAEMFEALRRERYGDPNVR